MNVIYNQEVILPLLLQETGRRLRFDFVIYDDNGNISRCIEFDGRQHFNGPDNPNWGTSTKEDIQERD